MAQCWLEASAAARVVQDESHWQKAQLQSDFQAGFVVGEDGIVRLLAGSAAYYSEKLGRAAVVAEKASAKASRHRSPIHPHAIATSSIGGLSAQAMGPCWSQRRAKRAVVVVDSSVGKVAEIEKVVLDSGEVESESRVASRENASASGE